MLSRRPRLTLALLLLALWPGAVRAAGREEAVRTLADRIDRHLEAGWKARGVRPAGPADEAAFLRRVYLDLVGRVPTLSRVRDYLDNRDPAKRAKLVAGLVRAEDYARHS